MLSVAPWDSLKANAHSNKETALGSYLSPKLEVFKLLMATWLSYVSININKFIKTKIRWINSMERNVFFYVIINIDNGG